MTWGANRKATEESRMLLQTGCHCDSPTMDRNHELCTHIFVGINGREPRPNMCHEGAPLCSCTSASPCSHCQIDLPGCEKGPVRGKPHQQRLGRRGLRKLAGPEWPGHCGPASGREHAQVAVKCARAEARRSAAERPSLPAPLQRSHDAGATKSLPCTFGPWVSEQICD